MTEEEFLRRIDRHTEAALANGVDLKHEIARTNDTLATMKEHVARANEHMARGNEHMARGNELMDEIRRDNQSWRAEWRAESQTWRAEIQESRVRWQETADRFEAEVRLSREQRLEEGHKTRRILDDLHAESRAGRDALFVILDEIRGRGGPAAAGA